MSNQQSPIPWWRVQFAEADLNSVTQTIQAEHLSLGPVTAAFEEKLAALLEVPYVVASTSGSMAILMALIAIGIRAGDEVIIPNRTWIAAAHAAMMLGAKPVFVDVCENIPNINVALIEEKITPHTKAIIPTTLNGRSVDIDNINAIAKKYNILVIEDAAQALFSRSHGKWMGTQTALGCFSLSMAKLIPTGQGGFVVTREKELYQTLRKMRTHGVDDLLNCDFTQFGFNFRYTDLQASIGISQLQRVDQKMKSMKRIYHQYELGLKNCSSIQLIPVDLACGELPLYVEVICKNRNNLIDFLKKKNIQSKAFYPNLNRAAYFGCTSRFVNADKFESQGLRSEEHTS